MTLKNYGSIWQNDHCLAVAAFILLDEKQMKKCFNWINLIPRYIKDNITKGNKINEIVSNTTNKRKSFYEIK